MTRIPVSQDDKFSVTVISATHAPPERLARGIRRYRGCRPAPGESYTYDLFTESGLNQGPWRRPALPIA